MSGALRFTRETGQDGAPVLRVAGEIDIANVDSFRAALADAGDGHTPVLVDLTAVDYLDSAAMAVLFDNAAKVRVVARALLRPVLTVSGLADITTVTIT